MAKPSPVRWVYLFGFEQAMGAGWSCSFDRMHEAGAVLAVAELQGSLQFQGPAQLQLPAASGIPGPAHSPGCLLCALVLSGALLISEPSAIAFSTYGFVIHLCQWIIWRARRHARVNRRWSWSGEMSCLRLESRLTKWYKVHLALSVCKACDRESKPCI